MIKPYHLLISFVLGGLIVYFFMRSNGKEIGNVGPEIHRLKAENEWRGLKEAKYKDSIKNIKANLQDLAKENQNLKTKAQKAEERLKQVKKQVPTTPEETLSFLQEDTVACDSALMAQKEYSISLEKSLIVATKEIGLLDSLSTSFQLDNKNWAKTDSLHVIREKELIKKGNKRLVKGLGIGGALGFVLALLL